MNTIELKALNTTMPVIGFNYDEIKSELIRLTEKHQGLIVTKETLKSSKTTQRELASLRKQIDTYRKDIKRKVKKPIDDFEIKCKELIAVVFEVENPIKQSLIVFEEERKKNQQLWVNDIVQEMIETYKLGEKYAKRITTEERFLNISITEEEVVNNIESQAKLLNAEQEGEKEKIQTIQTFIASTNKNLNLITPLTMDDIYYYWIVDQKIVDLQEVLVQIEIQGAKRKDAEQKAQEVKPAEPIEVKEEVVVKLDRPIPLGIDTPVKEPIKAFKITLECTRTQLTPIIDFIKAQGNKIESVKYVNI